MLFLIKLIKKFLKILNAEAAPWQIGCGAALGLLLGLLPMWPFLEGPSPLSFFLLFLVIVINCHLGSVLLFSGLGALLYFALVIPADLLAPNFEGLAASFADIWFLHMSLWSHSGWLSLSLIGFILAPFIGFLMARLTHKFQTVYKPKLLEKKKLIKTGKIASNGILLNIVCWFFDI